MAQQTKIAVKTGTRDTTYNLISTAYHALQGAETYLQYAEDAGEVEDTEAVEFFREVIAEERRRADRAKSLLRARLKDDDGNN